jgi:hypothetical protein
LPWIPGQDVDDTLDLGYAFDVDTRAGEGLNQPGKLARPVVFQPDSQIAGHWQRILAPTLTLSRKRGRETTACHILARSGSRSCPFG